MAEPDQVIIGRQELVLKIGFGNDLQATNQAILELCQEKLPEYIESFSKQLSGEGNIIIPRLEIDLGTLNPDHMESEFLSAFERELENSLNKIIHSATEKQPDQEKEDFDYSSPISEMLYFALNGTFPWYVSKESGKDELTKALFTRLEELAAGKHFTSPKEKNHFDELYGIFNTTRENAFKRLSRFLGTAHSRKVSGLIQRIVRSQEQGSVKISNDVKSEDILDPGRLNGEKFTDPEHSIRNTMEGLRAVDETKGRIHEEVDQERNMDNDPARYFDNALFTGSAGVVILNPFLKPFFQKLKLVEKDVMVHPEKASLVLYHLCHDHNPVHEGSMVFEKILTGMEVHHYVDIEQSLPKRFPEEKDELLISVIGHWTALKNTSPEGLQKGFLQRDGKIVRSDGSYDLKVESKGHDVLLGRLPWNISLFHLPWMKYPVTVDWI